MTDSTSTAAPAAPETPPAGAAAPAAPVSAPAKPAEGAETLDRRPTGNAFLDKSRGFGAKLDGKLAASEQAAAAKGTEPPKEPAKSSEKAPEGAKDAPKPGETPTEPPKEGEKPKEETKPTEKPAEKPGEGAAGTLSLVSKDGKAVAIAWPEGAVLRVKGSGKIHTIDRPEKVIELVQKGLDYGPATSRLGERAAQAAQQLRASQEASQKVLLAVLFGDGSDDAETIREQLMPQMRKYLDPEYREGLAAKKELAEVKASSEAERDADATALAQAVMDDAEQHVTANLGKYEYLEASDIPTLQQALHGEYERRFNARLQEHLPGLRAGEVSNEEVQADCEAFARAVLNTEALDILMQKLNESYAKRLVKARGGAAAAEPPKPALPAPGADAGSGDASEAAIAAHNGKTDQKLEQAATSRTLRGAGSPPSTAPGIPRTDGMSFEERRKLNSNRLRTLGGT